MYFILASGVSSSVPVSRALTWLNGKCMDLINYGKRLLACTVDASHSGLCKYPTVHPILLASRAQQAKAGTWAVPKSKIARTELWPSDTDIHCATVLQKVMREGSTRRICILFSSPGADPMTHLPEWVDHITAMGNTSMIAYAYRYATALCLPCRTHPSYF